MTTPHTDAAPLGVERTAPDVIPGLDALAQVIALNGVRSIDDALAMGAAIVDPNTGDVEWLMDHGCDVIDQLLAHVRRLTAALADSDARVASAVARDDGAQWRPVDEDTAFAPPFSTIRACRWCGCLVAGGPTACARCADSPTGGV